MDSLVTWFIEVLGGRISRELVVFIISMVPILELRGGLLAASAFNIDIVKAIWICVVGNIIPVPFILLLITPIFQWLKQTKLFRPMVEKLENKAMGKSEQIEKYEFWGLVLFVGIPLPGTGAWTGSLIASLLGIKFRKAFPAVILGIVMATVIMSIVSYGLLGALLH
ncbi:MAG: small multi-drug export protein [Lachnospiraceae bacterium]|nr:small multi-drug export protein [Lachnospiraceae bacterium]